MKRETMKPDWSALERIESRLRAEKSRLARLEVENNAARVDLERIAREIRDDRKSPVWLEILGGLLILASVGAIMLGMMLLP